MSEQVDVSVRCGCVNLKVCYMAVHLRSHSEVANESVPVQKGNLRELLGAKKAKLLCSLHLVHATPPAPFAHSAGVMPRDQGSSGWLRRTQQGPNISDEHPPTGNPFWDLQVPTPD